MLSRFDVCEGAFVFYSLYGGGAAANAIGVRLSKLRFSPRASLSLDTLEPEGKVAFAGFVRRYESSWLACERICRRARISWPGVSRHGYAHTLASVLGVDASVARAAMAAVLGES